MARREFRLMAMMMVGLAVCMGQTSAPATQADKEVSATGTLRTGVMAVGGETTGTELRVDKDVMYELDLGGNADSAKKADSLKGQQVTVTGTLRVAAGVERGPRKIIKVETLEKTDVQK